ncbi:MAG: glycosyltransferase family 4 protein [Nitrospirae bacterium]|nr:glycosyltransferase family 4 protein [Nitrospirota bacterium]
MKITFILPGWTTSPVGGFKVVYEYSSKLAERGHFVSIVHPLDLDNSHGLIWRSCIHIRRYAASLLRGKWFNFHSSVNFLVTPSLEEKYVPDADYVVATAWRTAEWVDDYSIKKGSKYYFVQHYETWSGDKHNIDRTLKLKLRKIVISQWLRSVVEELGEMAEWVPNGIDSNTFTIQTPIEDRDMYSLGMLYHESAWKGFDDGLKALTLVKAKYPKVSLKLFGVFPKRRNLPDWVTYTRNPSLVNLVALYNSMSIFVHTSLVEGWGLTPAEAMACGCAVVATDSQGILDYAEHEKNALISPPRSPEKLAENIISLIENRDRRVALAKAGHERIRQFTWDKSVNRFEEALAGAQDQIRQNCLRKC